MYYDQNGDYVQGATDITNNKVYVSTSKSIAPTGIENEFDITLQVKTKADIQ